MVIRNEITICFVLKNLRRLFDKYAVACTENDALVKSTTKFLSNFVAFSENPNFTFLGFWGSLEASDVGSVLLLVVVWYRAQYSI